MTIDLLRFDRARAIAALERFLELTAADRRDRATRAVRKAAEDDLADGLAAQGREFRKGLVGLKAKFQDPATHGAVWPGDWIPYFDSAAHVTRERMREGLYFNMLEALVMGGGHLVNDVGVPLTIAFNLENPRAVAWAVTHAAEQVTRINAATREGINRIIVAAVENGTSYTRVAGQLREAFEFSRGRAQRIAVYEIGNAYEAGREAAAREMTAQGLVLEKAWMSAGDQRVRPAHRENEAAGWIPLDEPFPSGDDRSPTDSGCRCSTVHRLKK